MNARLAALPLALTLALAGAPARAADACSNDVFSIDGTSVTVAICATPAAGKTEAASVILAETLSAQGRSMTRQVAFEPLAGVDAARSIDDAPLQKLGIAKTLHLTIEYRAGSVRLTHALLVPGAIALK